MLQVAQVAQVAVVQPLEWPHESRDTVAVALSVTVAATTAVTAVTAVALTAAVAQQGDRRSMSQQSRGLKHF